MAETRLFFPGTVIPLAVSWLFVVKILLTAKPQPKGETVTGQVSRVSGAGMRQPSLQGRIYGVPAICRSRLPPITALPALFKQRNHSLKGKP